MAAEPDSIIAYQIHPQSHVPLAAAPIDRQWMDESPQRFAYRCLPLNIANQNGWVLTSPAAFRCYWYGGVALTDLEIRFDGPPDAGVMTHFGSGILTFGIPYLFRCSIATHPIHATMGDWLYDNVAKEVVTSASDGGQRSASIA